MAQNSQFQTGEIKSELIDGFIIQDNLEFAEIVFIHPCMCSSGGLQFYEFHSYSIKKGLIAG